MPSPGLFSLPCVAESSYWKLQGWLLEDITASNTCLYSECLLSIATDQNREMNQLKSLCVWRKLGSHFWFTEIKISIFGRTQLFPWNFFISACLSGLLCYAVLVLMWRPWQEVLLAGVHCSAPVTISHYCITVEMLLMDMVFVPGFLYIWEQLLWNKTLRTMC